MKGISTEAFETELSVASKAPLWSTVAGTFFYAGYLKPAPGTWGSIGGVFLWAALGNAIPPQWRTASLIALAIVVTAIGIPAATRVARGLGKEDPSQVVIDEVAGQLITLIHAPLNWKALLVGLILFRLFDITKPFPLRRLENLPEGTGIMLDDVGAGLYGLVIMQALVVYGILK